MQSPVEHGTVVPARDGRLVLLGAVAMFAVLSLVYTASIDIRATRGASITGDEPFYLLTTQSLWHDGDLDLTQQYERRSYRFFFDHPDGLWRQSVPRENGVLLSPHNPGLSFLVYPGFRYAGLLGVQVQLLVLAALTFALTYILTARTTGAPVWSWLATAAVALSASAFVHATEIYPEVPGALVLVSSLLLAHSVRRPGVWHALALAVLLTALMWLSVKYVPLAGLVALWFLFRAAPRARIALLAAGALSAAYYAWFHLHTFGFLTPYSVGAVYAGDATLDVVGQHLAFPDRFYRLWGLFIDERFGVGRWAPVLLPAVPALVLLWRRGGTFRLVLALFLSQVLVATFVNITMMGWWFPGRILMVVLPLLAVPLALLWARLPRSGQIAMGVLAVHTVAITTALAQAGHAREIVTAVDPFDMRSPVFQAMAPFFPNYTSWDLWTVALTAVWLIAAVAAAMGVTWMDRRTPVEPTDSPGQ
ncbi:MAG: hypothetical protein WD645_04860 [Dehalococcoidia bacterium]